MTSPLLTAMNRNDGGALLPRHTLRSHYAEVPTGSLDEQSQLIEQVISFAFDTLGVRHLDVRVFSVDQESRRESERSLADRRAHFS
jgi:hypothetical protein